MFSSESTFKSKPVLHYWNDGNDWLPSDKTHSHWVSQSSITAFRHWPRGAGVKGQHHSPHDTIVSASVHSHRICFCLTRRGARLSLRLYSWAQPMRGQNRQYVTNTPTDGNVCLSVNKQMDKQLIALIILLSNWLQINLLKDNTILNTNYISDNNFFRFSFAKSIVCLNKLQNNWTLASVSSLPGIGYVTNNGLLLVSTTPTVGISILAESMTAGCVSNTLSKVFNKMTKSGNRVTALKKSCALKKEVLFHWRQLLYSPHSLAVLSTICPVYSFDLYYD